MIKAECVNKYRDDKGIIKGYTLQATNGDTRNFDPNTLKHLIKTKQIEVINLTLTSDGRLIKASEKKDEAPAKIDDFGEKIGGARKDIMRNGVITPDSLDDMNEAEMLKYVSKDKIWKEPDYQALFKQGYSVAALYFIKTVRGAIPKSPIIRVLGEEDLKDICELYIGFVQTMEEIMMLVTEDSHIDAIGVELFEKMGLTEDNHYVGNAQFIFDNRLYKAIQMSSALANYKAQKEGFDKRLYNISIEDQERLFGALKLKFKLNGLDFDNDPSLYENEAVAKKMYKIGFSKEFIKQKFNVSKSGAKVDKSDILPKQLENVIRTGCEVRDHNIVGSEFMDKFNVRAGEFGNWLNDLDRQASINMAYEAFCDLAIAMDIDSRSIGLCGKLALAFGSRGKSYAVAHYEPEREVINLTKMKGAGSLAHEYFHAMDDNYGKFNKCRGYLSNTEGVSAALDNLLYVIKHKPGTDKNSDYYNGAMILDKKYHRSGRYYSNNQELCARAFACYIADKLEERGIRDDYLCGHARTSGTVSVVLNGETFTAYTYPLGDEMKAISEAFDKLISEMKQYRFM